MSASVWQRPSEVRPFHNSVDIEAHGNAKLLIARRKGAGK